MKSATTNTQKRRSSSARMYSLELQNDIYVDMSEIVPLIDRLHQRISAVEWSGILFYEVFDSEGSKIDDTERLINEEVTIKPKYILPLNKGSAAYTEYETDMETLMDATEEHPELEDCITGHIHSHVNMGTSFSGTDDDQLKDGAFDNEMFLSIIVNQKDNVTARLSFKGKVDTSPKVNLYQKEISLNQSYEDAVFYVESKVYKIERDKPEDFFEKQLEEICKPKTTYTPPPYGNGYYNNPAYNKGNQHHTNNYNPNKSVGRTNHEKKTDLEKRAINILTGLVEKSVSDNLGGTQKQKIASGMYSVVKTNDNKFLIEFYLNAEERFNNLLDTSVIDEFKDLEQMNDFMSDILIEVARGSTPNGGIVTIEKHHEQHMMQMAKEMSQTLSDALDDVWTDINEKGDIYNVNNGVDRPF